MATLIVNFLRIAKFCGSKPRSDFGQTLESCTEKAQFGRQLRLKEFLEYLRLMGVIQCQTVVRHFSQLIEKVKLSRQL